MISPERIKELFQWMNWDNGMGAAGGKEPPYPRATKEEDAYIRRVWRLLPNSGHHCYFDAMMAVKRGEDRELIRRDDSRLELFNFK